MRMAASLAKEIGDLLRSKGLTLSVAESCTGGKLGDLMTDISGSSDYFMGGVISYSNEAKMDLLGVTKSVLESKGAVSEEVAAQMAAGVRKALHADIGVGITGIAGPTGATPGKPVGLVYIALSSKDNDLCSRNLFRGSRALVKKQAAGKALKMVKEYLAGRC